LLGYFTDNELRWGRDHRAIARELLDDYLNWPPGAPGKQAAVSFLEGRYGGRIEAFNAAWGTSFASFAELLAAEKAPQTGDGTTILADKRAFLALLAERYFQVTTAAIRAADPNHLILGCRAMSLVTPSEVARAAGRYVDVMSVNSYVYAEGFVELADALFGPVLPPADFLAQFAAESGKPLLVSEFGFRAADAGMPNSWPPVYPVYPTQLERAAAFEGYVREGFGKPYVVGLHWFQYTDQPREGRFYDGEDNSFGLVDLKDDPYPDLVHRVRDVYAELLLRMIR
jgi:hypothetical protein